MTARPLSTHAPAGQPTPHVLSVGVGAVRPAGHSAARLFVQLDDGTVLTVCSVTVEQRTGYAAVLMQPHTVHYLIEEAIRAHITPYLLDTVVANAPAPRR